VENNSTIQNGGEPKIFLVPAPPCLFFPTNHHAKKHHAWGKK
jgi:hypothetical protein